MSEEARRKIIAWLVTISVIGAAIGGTILVRALTPASIHEDGETD